MEFIFDLPGILIFRWTSLRPEIGITPEFKSKIEIGQNIIGYVTLILTIFSFTTLPWFVTLILGIFSLFSFFGLRVVEAEQTKIGIQPRTARGKQEDSKKSTK